MGFSPDRLRGYRHGQKLSVETVASAAGMAPQYLAAVESAQVMPTEAEIETLAEVLCVAGFYPQRPLPTQDYLSAVLEYARSLTEDEIEIAARTIHKIRAERQAS